MTAEALCLAENIRSKMLLLKKAMSPLSLAVRAQHDIMNNAIGAVTDNSCPDS